MPSSECTGVGGRDQPCPPSLQPVLTALCPLPSDLSFDSSDLVTLKSLLAGLSLPSRDGRADHGLDEEGEGEWAQQHAALTGDPVAPRPPWELAGPTVGLVSVCGP